MHMSDRKEFVQYRYFLIVIVLGIILMFIGSLLKLNDNPLNEPLLLAALLLEVIGLVGYFFSTRRRQ